MNLVWCVLIDTADRVVNIRTTLYAFKYKLVVCQSSAFVAYLYRKLSSTQLDSFLYHIDYYIGTNLQPPKKFE